jgi:hypothetical protein
LFSPFARVCDAAHARRDGLFCFCHNGIIFCLSRVGTEYLAAVDYTFIAYDFGLCLKILVVGDARRFALGAGNHRLAREDRLQKFFLILCCGFLTEEDLSGFPARRWIRGLMNSFP